MFLSRIQVFVHCVISPNGDTRNLITQLFLNIRVKPKRVKTVSSCMQAWRHQSVIAILEIATIHNYANILTITKKQTVGQVKWNTGVNMKCKSQTSTKQVYCHCPDWQVLLVVHYMGLPSQTSDSHLKTKGGTWNTDRLSQQFK